MSSEDEIEASETELKELVTQALEENGLLSKIRAQLRAGLYIALENEINETNKFSHINATLKSNLANPEIRTIFCLVLDFLSNFNLDFTKTVFEKESYLGLLYNYDGKDKLINELELGLEKTTKTPLLIEILRLARRNGAKNESTYLNESKDVNKTYDIPLKEELIIKTEENNSSLSSVESKNSSKNDKTESPKIDVDGTYEGTSSLAEDSFLIDLNKTAKIQLGNNAKLPAAKTLIDQTISYENGKSEKPAPESPNESSSINKRNEKSPRISPNSSSISDDSPKTPRLLDSSTEKKKHEKTFEKPKPMSGLTSLSDLPPIQITKTRSPDTVLLPSLYSKEFREKSNLKDIDKFLDNFDSIDNYEEDDILSTSLDYDKHKNINAVISKSDLSLKNLSAKKLFENSGKVSRGSEKVLNNSDVNSNSSGNNKDNDNTSISEDLDFNSNSEELKSGKGDF